MPVVPPRLDDMDYAKIEAMLRTRIPVVAPEWTDHNDSDPGITLIQLFAYLAEQIGYRLNRVPDKTYVELLKLVGVRLRASVAASALMAFFLTKPERATAVLVPIGIFLTYKAMHDSQLFSKDFYTRAIKRFKDWRTGRQTGKLP